MNYQDYCNQWNEDQLKSIFISQNRHSHIMALKSGLTSLNKIWKWRCIVKIGVNNRQLFADVSIDGLDLFHGFPVVEIIDFHLKKEEDNSLYELLVIDEVAIGNIVTDLCDVEQGSENYNQLLIGLDWLPFVDSGVRPQGLREDRWIWVIEHHFRYIAHNLFFVLRVATGTCKTSVGHWVLRIKIID